MSLGPINREEFGVKKIDQVKSSIAKAVRAPARTIFYVSLTGLLGGIMFGVKFDWQAYVIIGLLWVAVMYQSFNAEKNK